MATTTSTATMTAHTVKRYRARAGTPAMSTGRLAMVSRGQRSRVPKKRKQAASSSLAFIGWRDYRRRPRGTQSSSPPTGSRAAPGPEAGSPRLAGLGQETLHEEGLKAILQLRGDGLRDFSGRAGALEPLTLAPALEVGVLLRRVLTHGERVDQVLELLGELLARRLVAFGGLDQRRDLLPVHDAVAGHGLVRHILPNGRALA